MKAPQQKRQTLRDLIESKTPFIAPGCGDPLGARLAERAGFRAVYMSGFAVEGSFAFPDVGLLGMAELAARAASIAAAVDVPLICDCDTGYGGVTNVVRTVREFERAGVAAVQFEDQLLPKKCGSMQGKRIAEAAEMVAKIQAAVDSRTDENLMVIGRTDAVAVEGLESAMSRLHAYAEAGADLLMALGPYTVDDVRLMARDLPRPLVYLNSESKTMPIIPAKELADIGIRMVVFPISLLLSSTFAMQKALEHIRDTGTTHDISNDTMVSWSAFNEIVDLPKIKELEDRYKY